MLLSWGALLALVSDGAADARRVIFTGRQSQYYDFSTYFGQGYFEFVRVTLVPYLCLVVFAFFGRSSRRLILSGVALCLFLGAAAQMVSGQRWPMAFYMVAIAYLSLVLFGRKGRRALMTSGLAFYLFVMFTTFLMVRYGANASGLGAEFVAIHRDVLRRITISSFWPTYQAFEVFPRVLDYQYGATWIQDLRGFLPGPDENFSVEYSRLLGQSWGSAPLSFVGELYANFGSLGVLVGSGLLGWIIGFFELRLGRRVPIDRMASVEYATVGVALLRIVFGASIGFVTYALMPIIAFRVMNLVATGVQRFVATALHGRRADEPRPLPLKKRPRCDHA